MKKLFSWILRPSDTDFIKLWDSATFVFDTNFLLDMYRVSHSTSEDFLKILEHLQERIWLPYQVVDEFLSRREDIIESESASFDKALLCLDKWKKEQVNFDKLQGSLNNAGRIIGIEVKSLFSNQDTYISSVSEVERCFREKINELAKTHSTLNSDKDYILEKLLSLFDGKVGNPYTTVQLNSLYKEGEDRYRQEKPPGFKDAKKDERKYGDFILWKQILDYAKAKPCSIIFVTGEKKDDWWNKKGCEIVSPHSDLRREFYEQVHQPFWMYQTQQFLEITKDKSIVEINPQSIEEVNTIAKAETAEAKAYEEVAQALQQNQTFAIRNNLIESLRPSEISLDLLEALDIPVIRNNLIESLRPPEISLDLLKALDIPVIRNNLIESLRLPKINLDLLKALENPAITGRLSLVSKPIEALPANGSLSNDGKELQDKLSNITENKESEVDLPLESFKKLNSQQENDLVNYSNIDTSSIKDKSREEEVTKPKKRSQSKKSNLNRKG